MTIHETIETENERALRRLIEFTDVEAHIIRTDEEAIEAVRRLAPLIASRAADRDRTGSIPAEELLALAESGLFAIRVPKRFGGAEVSYRTIAEVIVTLSAASGSVGQIPQNHYHLLEAIFRDGTQEQQSFFARELLSGKRLGNALSERNGRPVGSLPDTRLTGEGARGWRVSGRKFYSTGAYTAQWIPVSIATEDGQPGMVFVPRTAPGVTVTNDWDALGQRSTHSGTATFDNVSVAPIQALVPWHGFSVRGTFAPYSTMIHASIDVGIGKGAIAAAGEYIRTRARPWGAARVERAADDPLIVYRFGKLATAIEAAEALLYRSAELLAEADRLKEGDAYDRAIIATAQAGAFAAEVAERFASEMLSWSGAASTLASSDLHRHWRDVRTHSAHDPAAWKFHRAGNYLLNGVASTQFGATVT